MEEKERYELIGYCSYRDTETGVIGDNFVGVLNEQDQKIKDLESKLTEKETDIIALDTENYSFKQQIDSLRQQLAEKEKKIEDVEDVSRRLIRTCGKTNCYGKNQTAIRELEKVKGFLLEKIAEKQSCFDSGNYNDFADGVKTICEIMLISIDKQINELKEMK